MVRWVLFACGVIGLAASSGCRCCPCFNCYANVIDDVGDFDVLFDRMYCPRLDVSRAGRPDWCGPINSRLCPCRCNQGTWKRYDECWRYPPSYPYAYPGHAFYDQPQAPATQTEVPDTVVPEPVIPTELPPPPQPLAPPPLPDLTTPPAQ